MHREPEIGSSERADAPEPDGAPRPVPFDAPFEVPVAVPVGPGVAEQWFRAQYESPLIFSGILDDRGRVLDGNHLSIEGCGLVRSEVIGRPFWECGWWDRDPEVASQVRAWCEQTLRTGESIRTESRYFLGDGRARIVDLALHPVSNDESAGGGFGYIVATGSDITDAVSAQREREARLAAEANALRASQDRFRSALDAMIDNVAIGRSIRDPSGAILDFELDYLNQASIDGAGRPAEELIGARVCELYPSWRTSGMFERFAAVVDTGRSFVAERLAYDDELEDGRVISGYWTLQITKLGDGYIAASRDVTENVQREIALRDVERAAERERIAVEQLQRAALPVEMPRAAGLTIGAHYQPASNLVIGGDWYDAFRLDEERLAFVIADVGGHGPDAAGYMVQIRNIVRAVAMEHREPQEILAQVNRIAMRFDDPRDPFTTGCVVVFDTRTRALHLALAGHPPALLIDADGSCFVGPPPGPPVGVRNGVEYAAQTITARPGDRLVLYTDGLIERKDESIDAGLARLAATATRGDCRDLEPQVAAEYLAAVLSPGLDDVALMVVDIGTHPPD